MIKIGRIANTHGIKGEVKIQSNSDFLEERLQVGKVIQVKYDGQLVELTIATVRVHKEMYMLTFEGKNNINDVEQYKQCDVYADALEVVESLEEGEFLYSQIIGCEVFDYGESIGEVSQIIETGANDVWVVKHKEKEYYIPYIDDVVKSVNVDEQKIIIESLEGMIE
ncbi:ribosome maturation factor RimM [Abyssicoccus albus]|uniref:Ribosome maturation factor RimM n=1 Tax=Abyssicoccus albus TaxID=1817405 RepID=A0A3N5BJ23_9BACL|nr:ribosome maturation factor RimM [Abyssicoccus albus]RPF57846.1 16S rRNA processing protein RimM [Abyssicoccus albus]